MVKIQYSTMLIFISILWLINRAICNKNKTISWKWELQLMLVYICIIVIVRFTFCPFEKVDGKIQPLIFYTNNWFPFRINWIPFVNLLDYPEKRAILLNIIGNTAMFIPVGIMWPIVYKELNTHGKVIFAGFGFSMLIEILQLPFFDRVTDIDDLILNTLGFCTGYGIYLFIKYIEKPR